MPHSAWAHWLWLRTRDSQKGHPIHPCWEDRATPASLITSLTSGMVPEWQWKEGRWKRVPVVGREPESTGGSEGPCHLETKKWGRWCSGHRLSKRLTRKGRTWHRPSWRLISSKKATGKFWIWVDLEIPYFYPLPHTSSAALHCLCPCFSRYSAGWVTIQVLMAKHRSWGHGIIHWKMRNLLGIKHEPSFSLFLWLWGLKIQWSSSNMTLKYLHQKQAGRPWHKDSSNGDEGSAVFTIISLA